jgi:hypothetical protein
VAVGSLYAWTCLWLSKVRLRFMAPRSWPRSRSKSIFPKQKVLLQKKNSASSSEWSRKTRVHPFFAAVVKLKRRLSSPPWCQPFWSRLEKLERLFSCSPAQQAALACMDDGGAWLPLVSMKTASGDVLPFGSLDGKSPLGFLWELLWPAVKAPPLPSWPSSHGSFRLRTAECSLQSGSAGRCKQNRGQGCEQPTGVGLDG